MVALTYTYYSDKNRHELMQMQWPTQIANSQDVSPHSCESTAAHSSGSCPCARLPERAVSEPRYQKVGVLPLSGGGSSGS